ncbi:hypothetical protein ABZ671_18705 [Micromonospora sp. NPDC006766]|uniref:hypothetical protein n=1 Tax=Micromonospora sp. NPDC006766 TaxID=3154778 RepID=UPI0033F4EE76
MDQSEVRRLRDEMLRRARLAAQRYNVDQTSVQHYVTAMGQRWNIGQAAYIAGSAHRVLLDLAEAHAECVTPACRECSLLGEAVAQIIAMDQADVDEQFAALAQEARRPGWTRWPRPRRKDDPR